MNKFFKMFIFLIMLFYFIPTEVSAKETINVYLFYSESCPHCKVEISALNEIEKDYPIEVHKFEVSNRENMNLFEKVLNRFNQTYYGVPFTVIGNKTFIGYSDSHTRFEIIKALDYYVDNNYEDIISDLVFGEGKNNKDPNQGKEPEEKNNKDPNQDKEQEEIKEINLPLFGKIDTKSVSLPLITVMIGVVDGFNPCAMWVLLFLITMLFGMKDRKKMWILGLVFIFTSAITYFIFMAAWLNLILFLGALIWIRLSIGIFGLLAGVFNIKSYLKTKEDGCEIVKDEKRKKIFDRIKKFTHEKNFLLAILGIIVLAISVNLIELLCSLGLPVIYTQLLSLSDLSTAGYYGYLLLYTFFFMLDDIIIFFIAMTTLKVVGVSTKYKKYSHLIGGILMFIIGLILIFKPEILMFG